MRRRILSILLCCVMVVGLLPTAAFAEDAPAYDTALYAQSGEDDAYTVSIISDQTYTGVPIEPDVTVKNGNDIIDSSQYTVKYEKNTNVGTAIATVTVNPDTVNEKKLERKFSIVKDEKPTVEIILPEKLTYDGSEKTVTAVAKTSAGNEISDAKVSIAYYLNQECTGQSADIAPNAAGEFWVKATLPETSNHAGATAVKEMRIAKATPTVYLSNRTVEYTGKPIEVNDATVTFGNDTLSSKEDGNPNKPTITYEYYLDKECQNPCKSTPTEPGEYYVKATATFAEESDYTTASTVARLTIEAAAIEGVATAGWSGPYDGRFHGITVKAPEGATVKYGTVKGQCNLDASPTYADVCDSTVYYVVTMPGHKAVTGSAKVVIIKADLDMTGVKFEPASVAYNGEVQRLAISGNLPEGVKVDYVYEKDGKPVDVADVKNVGTYKVQAIFALSDALAKNYNVSASMTATLTIVPAQIDVSGVQFVDVTEIYDGAAKCIQVTNVPKGVTVACAYEKDGKVVDPADVRNAGIYKATATFAVVDAGNTELMGDVAKTATLTIDKKRVDIPMADATVFEYNGKEQTYAIAESDWYSVDGNKQTAAGTYDVKVSLKDANNTVWSDGTSDTKVYKFTILAMDDEPGVGSNQGNAADNGSDAVDNGSAMAATADGMAGAVGVAAAMGAIALAGAAFAARRRHND